MTEVVRIVADGPITTIWLNRPAQKNAMLLRSWTAIMAAVSEAEKQTECCAIVIRGAAGNFDAGADIVEFAKRFTDRTSILTYFADMEAGMASIEAVSKPTIAAIEGYCFGASVAMALACDVRIASTKSLFAITPAKLGISYPYGDVRRVVSAIGPGRAKSLLLTGRRIAVGEAFDIGLVDQVEPAEQFETALEALTSAIAQSSQHSIRASKAAITAALQGLDSSSAGYPDALVTAVTGGDFMEGMAAFIEKRHPVFPFR